MFPTVSFSTSNLFVGFFLYTWPLTSAEFTPDIDANVNNHKQK